MGLTDSWKRRWRRVETLACLTIIMLSGVGMYVGHRRCISYARGGFFFVMTDGYIVVPWPIGQQQVWGNWGWWVQSPWLDNGSPFGVPFLFPEIQPTRQINGIGLHVSFLGPALAAIIWFTIRRVERLGTRNLAAFTVLGWIIYILALDLKYTHLFAGRMVPTVVWEQLGRASTPIFLVVGSYAACVAALGTLVLINRSKEAQKLCSGLCRNCRYNLTGNTSGRCPECGTPLPETVPSDPLSAPRSHLDGDDRSG